MYFQFRSARPDLAVVFLLAGLSATGLAADDAKPAAPSAEQLWSKLAPFFTPPAEFSGDFGKYSSPLKFDDGRTVEQPAQWPERRAEILRTWHKLLGPWPALLEKPQLKYVKTEQRENFTQHHVHVDIGPGKQQTNGYLLIPEGKGPFPAVLVTFYDAETSIGLGEKGKGLYDFGYQLAKRGFVTLSIATPGYIEHPKRDTRELLLDAAVEQGRQPLSILAYASANCHTVLAGLPEVDPQRIGVVGLSYGGKWAMFSSCLYDKFACAVWSDPGIVFDESNRNINYWEPWYLGYEPGARRRAGVPNAENPRTGLYKQLIEGEPTQRHDLHELHALMAPRPFLVSGGSEDHLDRWKVLNHTAAVNKLLGYTDRIALTSRQDHIPDPEAAEQTCLFFEYFLKQGKALGK